jgi:hypothetical protein
VPGVSTAIDLTLLLAFAQKCKKVFGLEEADIKAHFPAEIAALFVPRVAAILAKIGVGMVSSPPSTYLNIIFEFDG